MHLEPLLLLLDDMVEVVEVLDVMAMRQGNEVLLVVVLVMVMV